MEAGVRYSAAGVVAEAYLASWSHSGKLLCDLPSPKRCGTRATITGSSYDAVLGPDGGHPVVCRVRASDPPVACLPGREPNRRISKAIVRRSTHRTAFSHAVLSRVSEFVGVYCGLLVWSARVPHRSIRLMKFALSDSL